MEMSIDASGVSLEQLSALATRSYATQREALDAVLQSVGKLVGMRTSFLSNISRQENRLEIVGSHCEKDGFPVEAGTVAPLSYAFCDMIANAPEPAPLLLEDIQHDARAQAHLATKVFPQAGSYIGVPVTLTDGSFYGTLCAVDARTRPLHQEHVTILLVLARLLATQIERERELAERKRAELSLQRTHNELRAAHDALEALATTDPVTGIPNHRAVLTALDAAFAKVNATQETLAICFVDLDHFKAVNDSYGHAAGDTVLREIGKLMRASLRSADFFGRWGGEEFVVVLPGLSEERAVLVAERLRATIANHIFPIGAGMRLTASFGVALSPTDAHECSELIEAADKAMYAAKRLGRNQVRSVSDPATQACALEKQSAQSRDEATLIGTAEALATLVDRRDHYTGEHTAHVQDLVVALAKKLQLDESETRMLGIAARLHDIGKVATPDLILNKPGKLDEQDAAIMRSHAALGAEIVSYIPSLCTLAPIIRAHHERWDGAGYPDQLSEERIPLGARIIAVADAFSAMTTNRPYRKAMPIACALEELQRCAGTQFDAKIVTFFIDMIEGQSLALRESSQSTNLLADAHP